MLKPCLTCGTPCRGSYCGEHQPKQRTHTRTTNERGYGSAHQRARARLARTLPAPCWYGCGTRLTPTSKWVAAHVVDGTPQAGWVVACPPCNERAKQAGAGQKSGRRGT